MKQLFISGIGTDIGKTVVSSILVEALEADYWKPIQSGDLDFSDTMKVKSLISNPVSKFYEEQYRFQLPASPHKAAAHEKRAIELSEFNLPTTDNNLIIEGAGGLLVPLNRKSLIIDLIKKLDVPVILVSNNYLGSINHTILSVEALQKRGINLLGIIFNGPENTDTEDIIINFTKTKHLGKVALTKQVTPKWIQKEALKFKDIV